MDEKLTVDEAIRILEEIKTIDDGLGQYIKDFDKAMNMAIRSLEAWEKVIDDIRESDGIIDSEGIRYGYDIALLIIDKHLKEVTDDE